LPPDLVPRRFSVHFIEGTKLVERPMSGSGEARELAEIRDFEGRMNPARPLSDDPIRAEAVSPNGRRFLLNGSNSGLLLFPLDGEGVPERI
jgi:hypothetical protein